MKATFFREKHQNVFGWRYLSFTDQLSHFFFYSFYHRVNKINVSLFHGVEIILKNLAVIRISKRQSYSSLLIQIIKLEKYSVERILA